MAARRSATSTDLGSSGLPRPRRCERKCAMKILVFLRSRQALGLLTVVVLAIVAIGIILPIVQSVREEANRKSCSNNLRQIGIIMANYEGVWHTLPSGLFVPLPP